ncbi:S1 RNA-binding domain-containing protein 1 [Bombina bombina]|uniref:S1 RNA-binding domain-containing protein 1 n=1 Tax=Bombina bombina TaxID=8345 RepID=UPI00235A5949|nr:S1 RNA-binding domain-containing protein 1 [Bombina bombina]
MAGLPRRARQATAAPKEDMSFMSVSESEEDTQEEDEWKPEAKVPKTKRQQKPAKLPSTKASTKKTTAKPRKKKIIELSGNTEKSEELSASKATAGRKIKSERLSMTLDGEISQGGLQAQPIKQENSQLKKATPIKTKSPKLESKAFRVKEERLSMGIDAFPSTSTLHKDLEVKKEEPSDDFTFGEPPLKKLKTSSDPSGKPVKQVNSSSGHEGNEMNWNFVEVLSEKTNVETWVCSNLIKLFQDENTIPFIARYRKELINNLDAEALREVQHGLEELRSVAKKAHNVIEKLKKEGKLNSYVHTAMLNCKTTDEIEHVYAPFKTGSKGTKAQRARQLGLEPAAKALIETPTQLNLAMYINQTMKGILNLEEVECGVQHILADMIAKDKDTLEHIRNLCKVNYVTISSTLAKMTEKEKKENTKGNTKDIDKFHLYHDFNSNVNRIQHHQILAINRGENLKILTVKVNIPDRVKDAFSRWCVNVRWRPKQYARPELMKILHNSVEDSYKRLIYPLLCREIRSKLTTDAEKESIMMFGRNLRQLLLANPVRGRTILGVDPGYKHGCKLAVISPTNQILHTDVVYLHTGPGRGIQESEKIKRLLLHFNCFTIAIGNGTACRETERYFADLIQRRFFAPLDVAYCITNEAGASIYSVSPEAAKEMPDLDPNLRSAVSIARRVQDPLAELVKIEPKHIGVGMYQHDVSQTLLKATLDSVVEECVSFVGVDINICSETLLRHIAGLNSARAKNIVERREKNGPFINREQLKSVKGLGPKSFQQCAGFIRINQEFVRNLCRDQAGAQASVETNISKPGKKATKTASNIVARPNPLDETCVHPESYGLAMKFMSLVGGNSNDIGTEKMQKDVNNFIQKECIEPVAQKLNTTVHTLQLIIDGLCQPEGYDIRTEFDKTDFKRNIVCLEDLSVGTVLTGKVENATLFGVFVDVGVGKAGLIPMRYITEAKLSKEKRRRSLGLGPGERVEVRVINIDTKQSKITLDLLRVI